MKNPETDDEVQALKDAVETNFPGISGEELNSLLWGATSFPAGGVEQICGQLCEHRQRINELRARSDFQSDQSDVDLARGIADAQMTLGMKNEVKSCHDY